MLILGELELEATFRMPVCPWMSSRFPSGTIIYDDVNDHLKVCDLCSARASARLKAGRILALANVDYCQEGERIIAAGAQEAETTAHSATCEYCRFMVAAANEIAAVFSLLEYMPGCFWLHNELLAGDSKPLLCLDHIDDCKVCSARKRYVPPTWYAPRFERTTETRPAKPPDAVDFIVHSVCDTLRYNTRVGRSMGDIPYTGRYTWVNPVLDPPQRRNEPPRPSIRTLFAQSPGSGSLIISDQLARAAIAVASALRESGRPTDPALPDVLLSAAIQLAVDARRLLQRATLGALLLALSPTGDSDPNHGAA